MKAKKKLTVGQTIAVIAGVGIIIIGGAMTIGAVYYNSYELKNSIYTVELGTTMDSNASVYVKAGNKKAVVETQLDFNKVNINQIGEYDASASYDGKTLNFIVDVKDTIAPSIEVKSGDLKGVVGQEVALSDYVSAIQEIGTISEIVVYEGSDVIAQGSNVADIKFTFSKEGNHSLRVKADDEAGNVGDSNVFNIGVVKDYQNLISGFHDISVQEGGSIDWMDGIAYDSADFSSVTSNSDIVDLNTVGTYTLTYSMVSEDGTTSFTRDVIVTVTAKPVVKAPSTSSSSSSSSGYSGGSSSSSGSGGSSGTPSTTSGGSSGGGGGSSSSADLYPSSVVVTLKGGAPLPGETLGAYDARTGTNNSLYSYGGAFVSLSKSTILDRVYNGSKTDKSGTVHNFTLSFSW